VAERDFSGSPVPTFGAIGHHSLKFEVGDVENRLVAGIRKFLRQAAGEFKTGDVVAVERRDLPDDLIPRVTSSIFILSLFFCGLPSAPVRATDRSRDAHEGAR